MKYLLKGFIGCLFLAVEVLSQSTPESKTPKALAPPPKDMIYRLRQVIVDGGLPDIGPALKQPYDASGYKIEVVGRDTP